MPTFLLTADLHLGRRAAATQGTAVSETEPELLRASESWLRLVRYAVQHKADAVLMAGDVVDEASGFFEAYEALAAGFAQLRDHGIPVFLTAGNHDYEVLPALLAQLGDPNVRFLGKGGSWESALLRTPDTDIQVIGWSFPDRYHRDDPLLSLPDGLVRDDIPVIGLLHGDYAVPNSVYAPLSPARLQQAGVMAWGLGHIHKPEVLQPQHPFLAYPGSPLALTPKESGAHGAVLLRLEGGSLNHRFLPLSPVRYETIRVPASGIATETELRAAVGQALDAFLQPLAPELSGLRLLVADFRFTGTHDQPEAFEMLLRNLLDAPIPRGALEVKPRRFLSDIEPPLQPLDVLAREAGPAGLLASQLLLLRDAPESDEARDLLRALTAGFPEIAHHPTFSPVAGDLPGSTSPETLRLVQEEALRLLTALIRQKEAHHG